MARPKLFDDEALLESARATFLELGPGVSSHELAKRAGVSEGTLFKRFGTKVRLFQLAMQMPELDQHPWFSGMLARAGEGDLEEHLRALAAGLAEHVGAVLPVMQTIHRHGGLTGDQIREYCGESDPPPLRIRARFRDYFAREMELGRMRHASPATLAEMFVGAVIHHCHVRLYFGDYIPGDVDTHARRLARDFVELTAPAAAPLPWPR